MPSQKQSVSFTGPAFAFARELVDSGEYPNLSAAVSGELVRAKQARDRDRALFEAELARRLELPLDQWEEVGDLRDATASARAYLARIERDRAGRDQAE